MPLVNNVYQAIGAGNVFFRSIVAENPAGYGCPTFTEEASKSNLPRP